MEQENKTRTETLCDVCHQLILPAYYFCPNCGKQVKDYLLSTSLWEQTKLYFHSIILPFLCFITISKWNGQKYLRLQDTRSRIIGTVATVLLILSTIYTIWFTITTIRNFIRNTQAVINEALGGL